MDLRRKEITPEERKIIIKVRNEGKTLWEIGKIVGRSHSSIQRVINNYTSSKSIISKPRSGRPSKLTAREKRYVFKSVRLNPYSQRIRSIALYPYADASIYILQEKLRRIANLSRRVQGTHANPGSVVQFLGIKCCFRGKLMGFLISLKASSEFRENGKNEQ
ncbi:uncharacterized protein CDAR_549011 [Caerostris darwini]|uniref:Transposase IS30-like HTH domain-containing protein n=1 Tax=Caerostris darwini TaxID=1538125 RepID=A0AAV4WL95_9ARAC|nr:uncharacterized protein CDAR_549011 [Caerostris darwini]